MQDKGLGDSIERITKTTGVKYLVDAMAEIFGKDCKCSERREKLNKLFPYETKFTVKNATITKLSDNNIKDVIKESKERFNV